MRIGLFTPPDKVGEMTLNELVQEAVQAEKDGFDSYWFVQLPTTGCDILTAIALAGQQTSRIELATSVVPTYPRHPLIMAQQALTTNVAAEGRLTLGLGLSHQPVIEGIMGLSFDQPARHMREYLSILRPLLAGEGVAFEGQFFQVKAGLQVPEAQPCSVLIAALAPLMLRLAGEMTEGTVTWMAGLKTIETHIAPRINAAAEAAERPAPRVCVGLPIAVTDKVALARDQVTAAFALYGALASYRRVLDIEGVAGPSDVAVVGNEAEVKQQLEAFAEAGTTDFIASIFPVGDDEVESMARTRAFLQQMVK